MRTVDAGDVAREFYRIREQHTGRPTPRGWSNQRTLDGARRFLEWCREQEIDDPLAFLRWRMDCAKHAGHPVGMEQLRSAVLAGRWKEWAEGRVLEQRQAERLARVAGTQREQAIKALRILTPAMEAAKYPFASTGRHALCLAQPLDYSGGFHPESRYCPSCPLAVRCAARLYEVHGFDVVALRAGRLYALPREVAAAAVR
jgi:hypothetical protein